MAFVKVGATAGDIILNTPAIILKNGKVVVNP